MGLFHSLVVSCGCILTDWLWLQTPFTDSVVQLRAAEATVSPFAICCVWYIYAFLTVCL